MDVLAELHQLCTICLVLYHLGEARHFFHMTFITTYELYFIPCWKVPCLFTINLGSDTIKSQLDLAFHNISQEGEDEWLGFCIYHFCIRKNDVFFFFSKSKCADSNCKSSIKYTHSCITITVTYKAVGL